MEVYEFLVDEVNEDKFAAHGVTVKQEFQVLDSQHRIIPNKLGRRAPQLLIGVDHGGGCLVIPIEPTHEEGVWRPITAWPCDDKDRAILSRSGPPRV